MIEVNELSRKYGALAAVDHVSFTARPGRVTGFLGPNGAGKTTTLRMLLGLVTPTAGMGHEDVEPITELIRRAAEGRTILLVEHNLSVVSTLSDRITVLQHGQKLAEGTYEEVSNHPDVVNAYLGGVDD